MKNERPSIMVEKGWKFTIYIYIYNDTIFYVFFNQVQCLNIFRYILHTYIYIYTHALPISQKPHKTTAIWIVESSEKKAGGAATRERTLGEM